MYNLKKVHHRLGFPVFPIQWAQPETGEISSGYRETGYFPEALINILALLGWNPGTEQEIFTMDELIEAFSLERIVKAGSRFDPEKAKWFNHQYLIKRSDKELAEWFSRELENRELSFSQDYTASALSLVKERAFLLPDLWEQSWFFFSPPEGYDEKVARKVWKEDTTALIREVRDLLGSLEPFTSTAIEPAIKELVNSREIGFGKVMTPLRLTLVGSNIGPGLMETMEVLGKEQVLHRIEKGLDSIPGMLSLSTCP